MTANDSRSTLRDLVPETQTGERIAMESTGSDEHDPEKLPQCDQNSGTELELHDQEDPLNWPKWKRYGHVAIVSLLTLVMNLSSTMFAPGASELEKQFGITNSAFGTLTVTIYMLGLVFGPLVVAPVSEIYGRLPLYHTCNLGFFAFTMGCAYSNNKAAFMVCRFLAGCFGSAPLTIGGGTIADVMPREQRGVAMGMFSLGPTLGPSLGPLAGGFIAETVGWRWTFRVLAIAEGVLTVSSFFLLRETFKPILLKKKAKRQSLNDKASNGDILAPSTNTKRVFIRSLVRPMYMLCCSPIVFLLSLSVAFAFGLSFLLITTFPSVFRQQYGFSIGISGLAYLGMGISMLIGVTIFGFCSDPLLRWHCSRGYTEPENRLALMVVAAPIIPAGFFWYGWSAEAHTHWIVPILGTGCIGIGTLWILMTVQLYLIDTFGARGAASALAANTILRSLSATFLPIAGTPLYKSLGLGWGNSLLGFLAVAFIPVPLLFYRYGKRLREAFSLNLDD